MWLLSPLNPLFSLPQIYNSDSDRYDHKVTVQQHQPNINSHIQRDYLNTINQRFKTPQNSNFGVPCQSITCSNFCPHSTALPISEGNVNRNGNIVFARAGCLYPTSSGRQL